MSLLTQALCSVVHTPPKYIFIFVLALADVHDLVILRDVVAYNIACVNFDCSCWVMNVDAVHKELDESSSGRLFSEKM